MITRLYTGLSTFSTTLVQSQYLILFTVVCILVTQPFDLSRYILLTWFGPGTQEYMCTRDVTPPFSTFIRSDKSLIHSLDLYLLTYLRTIELYQVLGQSPGILTCLFVVLLPYSFMRGHPSLWRVFWGRVHFSASLPLLAFINNVSLLNPSLDPACAGEGVTPWMNRQDTFEASTRGGADASLLEQNMDSRLASTDSLRTATQFHLARIPSVDKALHGLGTFAFIVSHLFSVVGRHMSEVAELLHLIKRL